VKKTVPIVDIFLDDGGHSMSQQRVTFDAMFEHVTSDGVFVVEDLATSYVPPYGGVPYTKEESKKATFIEYCKQWTDWLNPFFLDGSMVALSPSAKLNGISQIFSQSASSIHHYSQIVVVEKGKVGIPTTIKVGSREIPYDILPWDGVFFDVSAKRLEELYE
jgi:hypothetical protein